MTQWRTEHGGGAASQVYPVNDLRPHNTEGPCWCDPTYDEEYDIVIHNSADRREEFETGERKPS